MIAHCCLCNSTRLDFFFRDNKREYWQCQECYLVQVPQQYHLNAEEEKAEYDKHQNQAEDLGYRRFLSRTTEPLFEQLKNRSKHSVRGLDFGSGPGPTLSLMAREQGFSCDNYDLYYDHKPEKLTQHYDFITATEVIEHIAKPAALIQQLYQMLHPQGILALMTKRCQNLEAFKQWHYKNDPTHICFYHLHSFDYIAQRWPWQLEVIDKDVVFLHKQ